MKKSIILSIAAAAAFATAAFTANTVSAATTTTYTNSLKDGKTKATINLTPGKTDENGNGVITLTSAPDFTFNAPINADSDTTATTNGSAPITVDNPGVASTWNVAASLGEFSGENGLKLSGATITLDAGTATNKTSTVQFNGGALEAGKGAIDLMNSEKTTTGGYTGVGETSFANAPATVSIPAGNVAGTYTADITWTLSATPTTPAATTSTTTTPVDGE